MTFALTSTDPDAAVLIDDFAVGTRGCTNYKARRAARRWNKHGVLHTL